MRSCTQLSCGYGTLWAWGEWARGTALTGVHDHDGREEPELGVVQSDGVELQREFELLQEEASHRHVRDLRPAHRQFTINVL